MQLLEVVLIEVVEELARPGLVGADVEIVDVPIPVVADRRVIAHEGLL